MTTKQHYIPQVYLRGFSCGSLHLRENQNKSEKLRVNYYDLINYQFKIDIPIKSICYKKNLYEVTDEKGNQTLPNYLEKVLGLLEGQFAQYERKLRGKAFIKENYQTKCFLTKEEKTFWITYISIQVMRSPEILELAEQTGLEIMKESINSDQARNLARLVCLPFFRELNEESLEAKVWNTVMNPMFGMSFAVCVDKEARFITSDNPVYIHSDRFPCEMYEKIIFPISSELCLIMLGGEEKNEYDKNFLFPVSEEVRKMVFSAMIDTAKDKIFLNHQLEEKERAWIKNVLENKVPQMNNTNQVRTEYNG